MHSPRLAALLPLAVLAGACGGSDMSGSSTSTPPTTNTGAGSGFFITISRMAFAPLNLSVPPGATVTVVNNDAMPHSVTSEASAGTFTAGAVAGVQFDTGIFSGGTKTFTIPANAQDKTVIHYFCRTHAGLMATPSGTVTVDASMLAPPATAGPAGGGTGGGGTGGGGGQPTTTPAPQPMPMPY